jgi:hypothetical protein
LEVEAVTTNSCVKIPRDRQPKRAPVNTAGALGVLTHRTCPVRTLEVRVALFDGGLGAGGSCREQMAGGVGTSHCSLAKLGRSDEKKEFDQVTAEPSQLH